MAGLQGPEREGGVVAARREFGCQFVTPPLRYSATMA